MESFTVSMSSAGPLEAIKDFFHSKGFVEIDPSVFLLDGYYIEMETAEFIMEGMIEQMDEYVKVSLRFALSNPSSVDACMQTLIVSFLDQWPTYIWFMSGTRQGLNFSSKDKDALLQALDEQIPILRHLWQSRTGQYKTAPLRVSEVYKFTGMVD